MAKIFISYAREDAEKAREIHRRLLERGYKPWLDEEDLLPGQDFRVIIEKSLTTADFVIVCLSKTSVVKRSFFQRELKHALDRLKDMRPEDVFLIPARIEECEMPDELKDRHWVDLSQDRGWEKLFRAIEIELGNRGKAAPPVVEKAQPKPPKPTPQPDPIPPAPKESLARQDGAIFEFVTVKTDERGEVIDRQTQRARHIVEDLGNGVRLEMVELPGGEFLMGEESGEHRVRVSPFFLGKYAVTQAQWRSVMGSLPKGLSADDHPVVNISWEEATDFCQRFSQRTNHPYRLPTEAEWEYACRANTTTAFAFGPTITPEIVNYDGNYPYGKAPKGVYRSKAIPVGSLGVANAFGLYDMHGNVWEWCSDWFSAKYYEECRTQGVVIDPQGSKAGSARVVRGGGWVNYAVYCRSAYRFGGGPGDRNGVLGFRLVRAGR